MTFVKLVLLVALFAGFTSAGIPCCAVTAIDTRTGVVTAKESSTGRMFQFSASAAVLGKLQIGQGIYANFGAKQVSVDGAQPCCGIIAAVASSAASGATEPPQTEPCCGITAIDAKTGVVTAKDIASGRVFQFSASAAVLKTIRVGQSIYADYATKNISIVLGQPCCAMLAPGLDLKRGIR